MPIEILYVDSCPNRESARELGIAPENAPVVRSRPLVRTARAIAPLVLAAALAGCGTSSGHGDGGMMDGSSGMMNQGRPATQAGPPATTPPAGGGTGAANGRGLFVASGCGGCHRLAAAGTTGTTGPDLDRAHPAYELVIRRVTDGGGDMPSFAESLTPAQIRSIARYVAVATR